MFGFMSRRKKTEKTLEKVVYSRSYDAPDRLNSVVPYVPNGGAGYADTPTPISQQWAGLRHYAAGIPPTDPSMWSQEQSSDTDEGPDSSVRPNVRAPDSRWWPIAPSRRVPVPTAYTFLRPFMQQGARQLNGSHFSMASNRRSHPIGGMTPAKERGRRNTYRLEPPPWDENLVDRPNSVVVNTADGRFNTPGSTGVIQRSNSYRLS